MIIETLTRYYYGMLRDPDIDIAPPMYSKENIGHEIVITADGVIAAINDLREITEKKKYISIKMIVPEQPRKSNNISPSLLSGTCEYILGIKTTSKSKKDNPERLEKMHRKFKELNIEILADVNDKAVKAYLRFLNNWVPAKVADYQKFEKAFKELQESISLIVFRMEGDEQYIHEKEAVKTAWEKYKGSSKSDFIGQCLITGKMAPIARIHPAIKGIKGGQAQVSLVTYNFGAAELFGKKDGENAPISEEVAFAYTTALNHLLKSRDNCVKIGDTTIVFWAEKGNGKTQFMDTLMADMLWVSKYDLNSAEEIEEDETEETDKKKKKQKTEVDPETEQNVYKILQKVRNGESLDGIEGIDASATFYMLGLSVADGRLIVKFFNKDTFGNYLNNIAQHYEDLDITNGNFKKTFIWPVRILREASKKVKPEEEFNVPDRITYGLMKSIIFGEKYPIDLYLAIMSRIRNTGGKKTASGKTKEAVNYVRAAMIKAYLNREGRIKNKRNGVYKTELDTNNKSKAYKTGRLFAVLEMLQSEAVIGVGGSIRAKFFASASTTPKKVFPTLLTLAQYHIKKAKTGVIRDKQIQEILSGIDEFPSYMNVLEQGEFMLGYYHQKQSIWAEIMERKEQREQEKVEA